ncbi:MAG: 2-C-methyl-D-erythritol 4-phosphate cytidylyltransferase [Acidimicrobiales bacterium]
MSEIWSIVVAGGEGRRFGAPKQFATLAGRPVVAWALEAARSVSAGVVLVLPESALETGEWADAADAVVAGGDSRSASVRAGLAAVPASADVVVVHDAARPLASRGLFAAVVESVTSGADGAIPGVALRDTVKRVEGGRVVATLDRDGLVAVQTPQAFRAAVLRRAHEVGADATDDAGLLEQLGAHVVVVAGEVENVKLTSASDLALVESYVASRDPRREARRAHAPADPSGTAVRAPQRRA